MEPRTMDRMPFKPWIGALALLLAIGAAAPGAGQTPARPPQGTPAGAQDPAKPAPPENLWPWGNAREAQRIEREFQGAWELVRADVAGIAYAGSDAHGYLIVQPGYCAFQARLLDRVVDDPDAVIPGFTAGTYRWSYDTTRLEIVLETLLGADDLSSDDGELRYERRGFRRGYRVELAAGDLTLTRGNESRLTFRRLTPPPPTPAAAQPQPVDPRERR